MKKISLVLMSMMAVFTFAACSPKFVKEGDMLDVKENPTGVLTIAYEVDDVEIFSESFNFELYYNEAPNTVVNFISLIDSKFYEGLVFHRYETISGDGKVLQGGGYTEVFDPDENDARVDLLKKDLKYSIIGEFPNNGWEKNTRKHENGSLAMARTSEKNSASSQFYVNINENKSLDGDYAVFGKITENTSYLANLLSDNVKTSSFVTKTQGTFSAMPEGKLYIKSITIDKKGVDFKNPIKIK